MVTETFQQPTSQVFQAAEQLPRRAFALGGQAPQQAAGFEDLQDQVGDLHEVIVRFEQLRIGAEGMFEIQAAVLLSIETLVLNVPAISASFRGDLDHRVLAHVQIGDPGKGCGLLGDGFLTDDGVEPPGSALVIGVGQIMYPAIHLVHAVLGLMFQAMLRAQPEQRLELLPDRRQASLFKHQYVIALMILGQLQRSTARIERIAGGVLLVLGLILLGGRFLH